MKLVIVLLALACSGCSFCLFETATVIEPRAVPEAAVAAAPAGETTPQSTAGAIAILKLLPIREFFCGEGEVRKSAIAANQAAGTGVRSTTRRRILFFSAK